jgi:hypothetical protein
MPQNTVVRDVWVAVLGAVAVGALTLLWNWASQGGVVRALGGTTLRDVQEEINKNRPPPGPAPAIDQGAVVAFDRSDLPAETCPAGWSVFDEGRGRVIVGAGDPKKAPGTWGLDEKDRPLRNLAARDRGGLVSKQLDVKELPSAARSRVHFVKNNGLMDFRLTDVVPCLGSGCNQMGALTNGFRDGQHTNEPAEIRLEGGQGAEFSLMQPFVALILCKKK